MDKVEQLSLDQKEMVVQIKGVEALIVEKFDTLAANGEQIKGEVKELGEAKAESIAKHEALLKEYGELYDRVQGLEQKGVTTQAEEVFNLGEEVIKNEQFLAMSEGKQASCRIELKTAIINATGQNQPLVQSDRLGGIMATPNRILSIRDVLTSSGTTSNLVEFTRESSFTNNAGPTVSGSPEAFENVTKPESAIVFTLVNEPVVTLAHFIPASKQVMSDSASLSSHINNRLTYGLKLKEETQLLSGSGSNGQLNGLITQGTAWANESPNITNELDIVRSAMKQAHVAEYRPDFLVLNPQDWFDIETKKVGSSDDRYVIGNPSASISNVLWGLPVVVSNSIASGTFLVGSSMGAEIKDREQSSVAISYEEGNNFTKNMVTVLAEERLALCVYRTEAFITGSL